jgi:hypothetical protein
MRIALIVGMTMATAACGGGGTNSAGTAPPPTSAPPTSTPTPTSTEVARQTPINSSLDTLVSPETFNTVASTATLTASADGTVSNVTSTQAGFKSDVTIAYNPSNQSYTVSTKRGDINNQTVFTSSDIDANSGGVTEYAKTISSTEDSQLLLTRSALLHYSSLGAWTNGRQSGSSQAIQASFFVFGEETAVTAMPKTGTATYQLAVAGIARDGSTPYGIGGSGTANVDFGASRLTTALTAGLYDGNGSFVSNQTLNGTATIASDFARFAGTLQGSVNGTAVSGPMNGAFFGPSAEEIGGSFKVSGGQLEAVGAFVGAK